ncbi:hypothetical protein HY969_02685 [Candidatus Kaiserbacteria bacterium]|nr:hypothetical protein [Candidatus Kaiserbacteria bacterium]
MNYVLFGVIGLFMFAITGIGLAEVRIEKAERAQAGGVQTETSGTVAQNAEAEVRVGAKPGAQAPEASEKSSASAFAVQAHTATTVPEAIAIAVKKVENGLFGSQSRSDDEYEREDSYEEEDEDDDEGEHRQSGAAASTNSATQAPAQATNTGASTGGTAASTAGTFTMAEVAQHSTAASCYSAINGSVYDLTSFAALHPGGQTAIKSMCGVDGTAAFNGQHGGQGTPASVLAQYKIGVVAK